VISCYQVLDEPCVRERAERALSMSPPLSAPLLAQVRAYQALLAFSYRELYRMRALLTEMLNLNPQSALPPEAPESMRATLEELRVSQTTTLMSVKPVRISDHRWRAALGLSVARPHDRDAEVWADGLGARLSLSYQLKTALALTLETTRLTHQGLTTYLDELTQQHLTLGVALTLWSSERLSLAVGVSVGGVLLERSGLLTQQQALLSDPLDERAGALLFELSAQLCARPFTPNSPFGELAVWLQPQGYALTRTTLNSGLTAWSSLTGLSAGLSWAWGGGARASSAPSP
jgi:hypothetical protein